MTLLKGWLRIKGQKSLWASLVLITALLYFTEAGQGTWYVAYRYLYFIPITLAAYFHGRELGMAVSLLCTSLFLPILSQQLVRMGLSGGTVEFIATLFLFNLWAWVTGTVGGLQRREKDFYLKLNQLGELLDQETQVDRLLAVSLEQSLRLTGAEAGRILLCNPEQDQVISLDSDSPEVRVVPMATNNDPATSPGTGRTGPQPLGHWLMARDRSLISNQVQSDPRFMRPDGGGQAVHSLVAAPMRWRGEVIGLVVVVNSQDGPFDDQDLRLLEAISDRTAMAVKRAWLYESEQIKRRMADTLVEVSQIVGSTLDLDEVLDLILDELRKVVAYDSASIQLLSGRTLEIISVRGFDAPAQVVGLKFPMDGDNPNHHVIESKAPTIVPDTHAVYPAFREPPHSHIRSWLGVPLLVKGEVIGMIALDKTTVGYFSQEDADVALTFANQVAMAIENARLYEETSLLAITDGLTGLYNRRYFYHGLEGEILRSERYGHPCSLIFFDIDDFKAYNDRYGHLAGDDLLKELGGILKEITRHPDTVARYGGEEFAIIQPETERAKALLSARRLWKQVREHEFIVAGQGRQGKITLSIGVATYPQDAKTAKGLVHVADVALYMAKNKGKDQICLYSSISTS